MTAFIGITGGSGAGKTTTAQDLQKRIGISNGAVIRHDAYYKDLSHLTYDERNKINFDLPDAFDNDLFYNHLIMLKNGQSIEMPLYDFHTHLRKSDTQTVPPMPIIIIEGIMLFCDQRIAELLDLKVFLDVPLDICLIRRLQRDISERGRAVESVILQHMKSVRPMYFRYVKPQIQDADIVLRDCYVIDSIAKVIQNLMEIYSLKGSGR